MLKVIILLIVVFCCNAHAATREDVIYQLFGNAPIQKEWFSEPFLAAVPFDLVEKTMEQLRFEYGSLMDIDARGTRLRLKFKDFVVSMWMGWDEDGKINSLRFGEPVPRESRRLEAILRGLSGKSGLIVTKNGKTISAINADQPLAMASAFKLAVLKALKESINSGVRKWDDVVLLDEQSKSYPSGILQDWVTGSPLTIHTLATLMMSISDNTATDVLINLLGRAEVERWSPRNRPFLTTREAFALKTTSNSSLLARFRSGNEAERRAVLEEIARVPLQPLNTFLELRSAFALDIEWFFSPKELCDLIDSTSDLNMLNVGESPARRDTWAKVSFKGGSEPGVYSLTNRLVSHTGDIFCVSVAVNDQQAIDESRIYEVFEVIIENLN
jgi:Beta-lactamase enzyme family